MLFKTPVRLTAQDVASRALCLGLVTTRADLERTANENPQPEVVQKCREIHERILEWSHEQGVWRKCTSHEIRILETPFGEWTPKEVSGMLGRIEAVAALLWTLNRCALPTLPGAVIRETVFERMRIGEETKDFVNFSALRNPGEIDRARHAAAVWHWRARAQAWVRHPELARPKSDVPGALRAAAMTAFTKGYAPQPIDGDFAAYGKPYRSLSDEEYGKATSVAHERHYALNWLTGQWEWDQVSTETEGLFKI